MDRHLHVATTKIHDRPTPNHLAPCSAPLKRVQNAYAVASGGYMRLVDKMLSKKAPPATFTAPTEPVIAQSTAPTDDESKHWPKTGKCYVTKMMFTCSSRADWHRHVQEHHRPDGIPV